MAALYNEKFGLSDDPFRLGPDPSFLFLTDQHREALSGLTLGILQRKGLVVLTGEPGTGKTTLLARILQFLPTSRLQFSNIVNPTLTASEFRMPSTTGRGLPRTPCITPARRSPLTTGITNSTKAARRWTSGIAWFCRLSRSPSSRTGIRDSISTWSTTGSSGPSPRWRQGTPPRPRSAPPTRRLRAWLTTTASTASAGISGFPFWPVNSLYTPPAYRADARISKVIPLRERVRLYLSFEVFNVSNTVVDTSITNQAYVESKRVLTLTSGAFGIGTASAGFPDGANARRAQVSARCVF